MDNIRSEVIFYTAFTSDNDKKENLIDKDEFYINMNEVKESIDNGTIVSIENVSLHLFLKQCEYEIKNNVYYKVSNKYEKNRFRENEGNMFFNYDREIKANSFSFEENLINGKSFYQYFSDDTYQDIVEFIYPNTPKVKIINDRHVCIPLMFGVKKNIKTMRCYTSVPMDVISCADFSFTANIKVSFDN